MASIDIHATTPAREQRAPLFLGAVSLLVGVAGWTVTDTITGAAEAATFSGLSLVIGAAVYFAAAAAAGRAR